MRSLCLGSLQKYKSSVHRSALEQQVFAQWFGFRFSRREICSFSSACYLLRSRCSVKSLPARLLGVREHAKNDSGLSALVSIRSDVKQSKLIRTASILSYLLSWRTTAHRLISVCFLQMYLPWCCPTCSAGGSLGSLTTTMSE